MSSNQDQARLIAERVARRLSGEPSAPAASMQPNGNDRAPENRRARIVNFVSATPPPRTQPSIGADRELSPANFAAPLDLYSDATPASRPQVAQSPWLAPFANTLGSSSTDPQFTIRSSQLPTHPSEDRFGVEEAAVSELVEFFENEKKCTVDPSGKPCDHCAMCSSRGF